MLLDLCAVQAKNGTANNATIFAPVGYETSEDSTYQAVTGWGGKVVDHGGVVGWVMLGVVGGSMLGVGGSLLGPGW